jgi:hypothetical protein
VSGVNEIDEMASALAQSAYLVGVFYGALRDQRLPDTLIESIVRDWHYAMVTAVDDEWAEQEDG